MILSVVERQEPLTRLLISARFTEVDQASRKAACSALALYARNRAPIDEAIRDRPEVLVLLIRRHFGLKVNMGRIADEQDVDDRTVRRWQAKLLKWLRPAEKRALDRLEEALERARVVDAIVG